jgi:hypothetical protein
VRGVERGLWHMTLRCIGSCADTSGLERSSQLGSVGRHAKICDFGWSWDSSGSCEVGLGVRLFKSVLDEKMQVVALVEHLAPYIWVQLAKPFYFTVLLGYEFLTHGRDLDVGVVAWEVEIGLEQLCRFAGFIPLDRELPWLVLPRDTVEIQESRELPLAVVCEFGEIGRGRPKEIVCAQFPAAFAISMFATRSAAWSGKSL